MSLETAALVSGTNKLLNRGSETSLANSIAQLNNAVSTLVQLQPRYQSFLKSNNDNLSSNVADGVLIMPGKPVPKGFRGVLEEFDINFTTVAGTVRLVILDPHRSVRIDLIRDISASSNGIGKAVLEEGETIAVMGQTAGAGTFSVFISGFLQKVII